MHLQPRAGCRLANGYNIINDHRLGALATAIFVNYGEHIGARQQVGDILCAGYGLIIARPAVLQRTQSTTYLHLYAARTTAVDIVGHRYDHNLYRRGDPYSKGAARCIA